MVASAARRIPVPVWLAALVVGSFAVRAWLGRGMLAPFIMVDELIYADLGRSFADSGDFLVRDVPARGYSVVYPILISPAYALFDGLTDAYAAVKAINALIMSLAAVPAYLLARRVVGQWLALLAAVLALALPSLAYTGTVMTENAFYPVFLGAMLAFVWALEEPTLPRQAAVLGAIAVAFATRVQALALVPALLSAPLLLAAFRRERLRDVLRPFVPLYFALGGLALLIGAVQAARGRSLAELFGAYRVVGDSSYELGDVLRYLLYHAAELDLYLGVVPVVATIVLAGRSRSLPRSAQALLAATLAVSFWLLLVVAAFASVFAQRIQERNTFVLAPLFLVLLVVWIERGAPRPPVLTIAAAVVAAVLPLTIPFDRFIETSAISDTLMLLPWWSVLDHVDIGWIPVLVFLLSAALAAVFVVVPARFAIALPLIVLAYFAVVFQPIWAGKHGVKQASAGALFQGIRSVPRDWIDEAVPEGAAVTVLWNGRSDRLTVNENEFFNRSVGAVYYTDLPTPGGFGETRVTVGERDGVLRFDGGAALRAEYLLVDGSITPDGDVMATDAQLGTTLWRVGGEVVSTTTVGGLYPNDTWSARDVTWTRRRCRGGEVRVLLSGDPTLFPEPQIVTASIGGQVVARTRVLPTRPARLRVPLPARRETCAVGFTVTPTRVPAEYLPDSSDTRVLGAHFNAFVYKAAR